jgi:hypothetical protein
MSLNVGGFNVSVNDFDVICESLRWPWVAEGLSRPALPPTRPKGDQAQHRTPPREPFAVCTKAPGADVPAVCAACLFCSQA